MNYIDVFNGDADGICALIQLRKANPRSSQLVTGVKRDIDLLKRIDATPGDYISVLDISFDKNRSDVKRLLDQGASIEYFDHHYCGALLNHTRLKTVINDQSSDVCTGLIVDQHIGGRFRAWALVAAFGDNMNTVAMTLGQESGYDVNSLKTLQLLGMYINYNSYGKDLSDLFYHPDMLYQHLQPYESPFDFLQEDTVIFKTLDSGYKEDLERAKSSPFLYQSAESAVVMFGNEKWARRINGVFINDLANRHPNRAHAVITDSSGNVCSVNIRVPLNRKTSPADQLAREFATGGGRKSAAGINALPMSQVNRFIDAFKVYFS
ncbi:DHH family phosphoesterase [Nitrosomonas sp.]|uniref:DHH family phosphoesterase n=1 Tax=Nitrosomonas sp. TaxID=42353 RepID=UPI0028507B58|nr:DHH family phosphoesterase [Nitrosomonas sp.]MDR4514991.1 DHH family phosphoesterase [Nitrosomonas sp.]